MKIKIKDMGQCKCLMGIYLKDLEQLININLKIY